MASCRLAFPAQESLGGAAVRPPAPAPAGFSRDIIGDATSLAAASAFPTAPHRRNEICFIFALGGGRGSSQRGFLSAGLAVHKPRPHPLPIAWRFNMTKQTHLLRALSGVALAVFLALPVMADHHKKGEHAEVELPKAGIAVMKPTKGNKVRGTLRLMQKG